MRIKQTFERAMILESNAVPTNSLGTAHTEANFLFRLPVAKCISFVTGIIDELRQNNSRLVVGTEHCRSLAARFYP